MKPTEVVMLTGYMRAHFPSQPVDEFTAEALGELLAPYPAADCRQAVLAIAERGEKWCAPTDVKAEVKRIRSKRIAAAVIEPPRDLDPDDTLAYRRALREATRAAADGNHVDPPQIRAVPMPKELAAGMSSFGVMPPTDHRARKEAMTRKTEPEEQDA